MLVLSPDEESSQKFIPFVGVSTSLGGGLPESLLAFAWLHLLGRLLTHPDVC